MDSLTLRACAKLNLALAVTGRREDGYHEMEMLMQSVSLHDTVVLEKRPFGVVLEGGRSLPADEENLAVRAARCFFAAARIDAGVAITLEKRIPFQAGLAGGSADAAAVLCGLNALYGASLSDKTLAALGLSLGADVPFCLSGGTAYVTGMGERIERVPDLPDCAFVIVKPREGIQTAAAFAAVDGCAALRRVDVSPALDAVSKGDLAALAAAFCNTFEQVTVLADVFAAKEALLSEGALGALMSGSGSAVFGLFSDDASARRAARSLTGKFPYVFTARPVPFGTEIV